MRKGLQCSALSTGYNRRAGAVLSGVSLQFAAGRFTALLGPNGCGKSTLLRALMGFLPAWEGDVTLDGRHISAIPRAKLARRVAWLPQESQCPDYLTVGELIELGAHAQGGGLGLAPAISRSRAEAILAEVGLEGLGAAQVNRLSGGQRQRAFIGMILAQDADIMLLDEPVNHLDIRYQYETLALVRTLMARRGCTVVAVLHDLNLAGAFADEAALMVAGRIKSHAPISEILTSEQIEAAWGVRGKIVRDEQRLSFLPEVPETPDARVTNLRVVR